MPQFQYKVKKGPGEELSGVLDAESQRAAVKRLRDMGYFPLSVEPYAGDARQDTLKQALIRIGIKDRNVFFRQLANLLESGMPIARALTTLVDQTENPKLVTVIERLRDDVQKGTSFADALEEHPKLFPPLYVSLVRAGEAGGMIEEVLWRIVAFGEQEEELRGKAISALIYPIFLLIIGSAAIFILMSFVFPKFVAIFEDFNAVLPWPTRIVMGICNFMGSFWWLVLLALGVGIAAVLSYARSAVGKRQLDMLMLHIPVVKSVVQRYEMAKFARTLGTLFDNGVPVLNALKITTDTLGNMIVREEVNSIHQRVMEGDSISDSLTHTKFFPPMVISMMAVGEESGRLGAVTKRVADAYDTEVDRAVKAMAAMFEPLLIVVMGIVIGFLVIAMLLPMLTLSANVAG